MRLSAPLATLCLIYCGSGDDGDVDLSELGIDATTLPDVGLPDAEPPQTEDWVAFVRVEPGILDRVVMARADGSGDEIVMPAEGELSIARHPTFSPSGDRIAYTYATTETAALRLVDLANMRVTDVATEFAALQSPDWSPDGSEIAFRAKATASDPWTNWVVTVDTEEVREVIPATADPPVVSALAHSCDGLYFFHIRGTGGPTGQTDLWVMDAHGAQEEQLTFGRTPTSLIVRVAPDCSEVVIDSQADGGPLRVGVSDDPPRGGLDRGFTSPMGVPGTDSNCAHAPGGAFVCERLTGPPPHFVACHGGGASCVLDIVSIDGSTNRPFANATESIGARETFPVAARLSVNIAP